MSKPAFCKMCDGYHWDNCSYFENKTNETIYFCSERHKSEYISQRNSPKISQEDRDAQHASVVAANRERREEKEQEYERKAIRDERQRRLELEEEKQFAEQEAKETAARKQRADELRSQGKNFQAFLVEFQNGIIGVAVVAGVALFFYFFTHNEEVNKQDAMKINSELELIEDSVKIYITNKNYDRALILTNKLIHTSHEDMENLEFDAWNGYPKFDEYWTKKKAEYKTIIFNKGTLNLEAEKSPEEQTSDESATEENKTNNNEKPKVQKERAVNEEKIISNEPDNNSNSDDEELDDEYKY